MIEVVVAVLLSVWIMGRVRRRDQRSLRWKERYPRW